MIKTIEEIRQEKTLAEIIVARDTMILTLHSQLISATEQKNELIKQLEEKNEVIKNLTKEES